MLLREDQIITYYLRNLFNSGAVNEWDEDFISTVKQYLKNTYDCNVESIINKNFMFIESETIVKCRKLLNGEIEFVGPDNVSQKIPITDITDYHFDKNLSYIADAFCMPTDIRPLLQCLVYLSKYEPVYKIMRHLFDGNKYNCFQSYYADALNSLCGVPTEHVEYLLSVGSPMFAKGILGSYTVGIRFDSAFEQLLVKNFENKEQVIEECAGKPLTTILTGADFDYMDLDFDKMGQLLKHAAADNKSHINILISGPKEYGITDFIAAVCAPMGLKIYSGPLRYIKPDARISSMIRLHNMLQNKDSVMLMNGADTLFALAQTEPEKRCSLEYAISNNETPIIWVVDNTNQIDESLLNKFSLIVNMPAPNDDAKKRIRQNLFKKYGYNIHDNKFVEFVNALHVPVDVLENAIKNAKLTNDDDMIKYTVDKMCASMTGKLKK